MPTKTKKTQATYSKEQLQRLIQEATVDCYDEEEQVMGLLTMVEDSVATPFDTEVLGVKVSVDSIENIRGREIAAVCRAGRVTQAISLADLPIPSPPPEGAEWIAAYRLWASTF